MPYSRQKLAHRPQRILLVDSLNKRGRKDVPCRPVGKKTIAIRPEILPITDRTPFMDGQNVENRDEKSIYVPKRPEFVKAENLIKDMEKDGE